MCRNLSVAVKTVKILDRKKIESSSIDVLVNVAATFKENINILEEALVLKNFDTFHIIKLLGIVSKSPPYFVVMVRWPLTIFKISN